MTVIGQTRLLDALTQLAHSLVEALDADACAISRALGDVLIFVTQVSRDGRNLALGQGYLVSDYPETQVVLDRREPRTVCLDEPGTDPGEQQVLEDLGYTALLMLPLELNGETWGLVEVYREEPRPFDAVEIRTALRLLAGLRQ
jgi:GAF domain-containing protein